MSAQRSSGASGGEAVAGRNGVVITRRTTKGGGYRTYEIYQRERVGESTEKLQESQLLSPEFLEDPYPILEILRENYPCFRSWLTNEYWITRYNDVTSIFTDDANFETRPKRWFYGVESFGRDLREAVPVLEAQQRTFDAEARPVAERLVAELTEGGRADLATTFAARYPLELLARLLDLPRGDEGAFAERYWRMQRGPYGDPRSQRAGLGAIRELADYFRPLLEARRRDPGEDLISALATLELDDGAVTAGDVVITLLEGDHETLHGTLANMWFQLLRHPEQLELARTERRYVKLAYLETLRHSAPVLFARRFARHEVERFGRLLPEGALLTCAAAAGNRDPRVFAEPDAFDVQRNDLCQREPRGQYRADGLASGIAFGLGKPSRQPAIPEDRSRSLYAITRDVAVTASNVLLDHLHGLRLQPDAAPRLRCMRLGEMHTCWHLPVDFEKT